MTRMLPDFQVEQASGLVPDVVDNARTKKQFLYSIKVQ
jgi:hypothetical protein